jgi:hypothetical protein
MLSRTPSQGILQGILQTENGGRLPVLAVSILINKTSPRTSTATTIVAVVVALAVVLLLIYAANRFLR